MVRTGASSYVRYDWEDTFGTAAFNNSTHKAFGLNARLGSWTLGHSPKDLPRLNQVEVAQYAYGQQNGSLSVDFVLSNPWIFRALYEHKQQQALDLTLIRGVQLVMFLELKQ